MPTYDHVFVIVMENHSYNEIIGSSAAPYINGLLTSGAVARNYYAVSHPSLPNYLALTGGSTYNITSDCTTCWVSASNLGDSLEAGGSTWKSYEESMPSACYVGDSYPYAQKHDPFIYFNDIRTNSSRCQSHIVPYSRLATDLGSASTTPNFAFITPNMCNDMHDCSIGTGDSWLKQQVPSILGSPAFTVQHSLLALTWDEDDSSGTNKVATIFLGYNVNAGLGSSVSYNHYSLLRTIEAARGTSTLTSNDSNAAAMVDMFKAVTTPSPTPCTGVSVAVNPASPQPAGTAVHLTPSASGCPNPQYELWIMPPSGGGWQLGAAYMTTTAFTWTNTGLPNGTYKFSLWARDASSPGIVGTAPYTYDAFSAFSYTLGDPPCITVTATAAPAASASPGAQVIVTAAATGCANPLYEFWLESPAGGWTLAQTYSTNASIRWATSGLAAGAYRFSVWARDATSPGSNGTAPYTYDSFSAIPYALNTTPCTSLSAPAAPAAATSAGTTVTISASAAGCSSPLFSVWLLPPNGLWSLLQPYTPNPTFTWKTAGSPAGAYRLSVWARDASSPGTNGAAPYTYDTFTAYQYSLTSVPCTSMTATASPLTTAAAGSMVTITGVGGRCPNPQYEFFVLTPGGSWTNAQAYSSTATLTYSTAGQPAGAYRFSVWVRDASSAGTNGTAPYTYDAFNAFQYTLT